MKILVTGGAGFIGSHIVDGLLAAGHSVVVIDDLSSGVRENLRPEVPLHLVDIVDGEGVAAVFQAECPDAVCHQAAQMSVSRSVREPLFDARVNCIGLLNVLNATVRVGCRRLVFASSGGVLYGDVTTPAPESTPANPVSPYGITKWVGERYLKFYAEQYNCTAVALRYSNVYGPRQNPHGEAGVVAIFCKNMLAGNPAVINGDGRYLRDYVYGPDVARANVIALTHELPRIRPRSLVSLNIGTGKSTDVNDLEAMIRQAVQTILERRGRAASVPAPQHGPARAGDLRSNVVDPALAEHVLGWRPEVSLMDGIAKTAESFATMSVHGPG